MAQGKNTTGLTDLLLKCMAEPDPMLSMLEWLCAQLMEAEVSGIVGAEKNVHSPSRNDYRCGYRPRRLDTRMGTMYLMVPKLRSRGYIPFFVTERKRSEAALIQVIQEAFVQGVSTRKMEKLARSLGIENLSRSQVSEMTKGLNEQVQDFRSRPLTGRYPVIWTDALYEKVRMDGHVVNMAVLVACGVNEQGQREVLAVEPMLTESEENYSQLFQSLQERGLTTPSLVVSDANKGLVAAIRKSFPGASWQRCKVHFMRNILAHVPQKEKDAFAAQLKEIWLAPNEDLARQRARLLSERYEKRFPKAIEILEEGLEDSLAFYAFAELDARKISSTNMLERLNKEIRRRTNVVGIFPNPDSYLRLVTTYLMEYAEDWSVSRAYLNPKSIQTLLRNAA
ncbi:IS256 family transposase [Oscillibacter sp.]|uniref:IS256 family transposase n=1 Tax=Oscillibacter sp. TaxID=1945593 RepID=UPI0028B0B40B|nr:IS256 family transposase [Oscillibacter sp.]